MENGTIGVITTLPEEVTEKSPKELLENEAPARFTRKVVFYRLLTFGLSFGCLIVGLVVRNVVHIADSGSGDFALHFVNGTTMATYSMYNSSLGMDNGTTMAPVYNGTE